MRISKTFFAAAIIAITAVSATSANAFDWNQFSRELQAGADMLAEQRWGQTTPPPARRYQTSTKKKRIVARNETVNAIPGVPELVGVRWSIDKNCNGRPVQVKVIQKPRYGKVFVRRIPYTVPAKSIRGNQTITRRCAGQPIIGYAVYYQAPAQYHANDNFSVRTVGKNGGLHFNYRVRVIKPVG